MNIKQLSLLGLASMSLITETAQASAFRTIAAKTALFSLVGFGAGKLETKYGFDYYLNETTLPEEAQKHIQACYSQHKDVNLTIKEANPSIFSPYTPKLTHKGILIPKKMCDVLKNKSSEFTQEEIDALLHIDALHTPIGLSSAKREMYAATGGALVWGTTKLGTELGKLKSSRCGTIVGLGAWASLVTFIVLASSLEKRKTLKSLQNSEICENAASAYQKLNLTNEAVFLIRQAKTLRAQGK